VRLRLYARRKEHLVGLLQAEVGRLSNLARFVMEKIGGQVRLEDVELGAIVQQLQARGYDADPLRRWRDEQKRLVRLRLPVERRARAPSRLRRPSPTMAPTTTTRRAPRRTRRRRRRAWRRPRWRACSTTTTTCSPRPPSSSRATTRTCC